MLPSEDKQQDRACSGQRLGRHVNMATVIESGLDDSEGLVEKSGTGIRAKENFDCRPPTGLLTCSAQFRFVWVRANIHPLKPSQGCQTGDRKQTWH